jgi:hypothetical protein
LWLKAIYFDSGAVRTPEEVIAKAYDSMPSVERPDFVPGQFAGKRRALRPW